MSAKGNKENMTKEEIIKRVVAIDETQTLEELEELELNFVYELAEIKRANTFNGLTDNKCQRKE